jgi:hypothetical protein
MNYKLRKKKERKNKKKTNLFAARDASVFVP